MAIEKRKGTIAKEKRKGDNSYTITNLKFKLLVNKFRLKKIK